MEINSTIAGPSAVPNAQSAGANAKISSDFQTFLRMLTAQIQNQDPLNPMESSDFAVQLATFSGVEQQVQTNDLLTALASRLGNQATGDLGQWIGMEVQFGDAVSYQGDPVALAVLPDARADQAVLVARNAAGEEVSRQPVAVGQREVTWQGTGLNGDPLAAGNYSLTVQNFAAGSLLSTTSAREFGKVTEARLENGEALLVLEGKGLIRASDVSGVREIESTR